MHYILNYICMGSTELQGTRNKRKYICARNGTRDPSLSDRALGRRDRSCVVFKTKKKYRVMIQIQSP